MPCGCEAEALAPCQAPSLAPVPVQSTGMAFDTIEIDPVRNDAAAVLILLLLGAATLIVLVGRHVRRSGGPVRLDLRDRVGIEPECPRGAPRKPLRLVLSSRERAFFARLGLLARGAFRSARARRPMPAVVSRFG